MNNIMQAVVIILVGFLIAAGVFYMNEWEPHQQTMEDLTSQISKLKEQKDAKGKIDEELEELTRKIDEKTKELEKLSENSKGVEEQVPDLLKTLEEATKKFDVQFADIRISPLQRNEQWSELPVEFTLRGTYHAVGKFLNDYENRKVINLGKGTMSITPGSEIDPKSRQVKLTIQMTGTVYVLHKKGF